jgi:hypothetical protein
MHLKERQLINKAALGTAVPSAASVKRNPSA